MFCRDILLCKNGPNFRRSFLAGGILAFLLSDGPSVMQQFGHGQRDLLRKDLKDTVSKWDLDMQLPLIYGYFALQGGL